ncbi:hypothetical protein PEL8287_01537 [Roseovarius litorisediminis]|uniref:Hedgehog/Intein (Hint) domain-containing protein n=1 Tax=Roseovarius litorisediminis TaxID=1312363 RepID=A0A1Y5S5B7_9RHOB|nr:Hint domain-containing protein [Roseovarius litorisediminis]SLN32450.1 hypothetical protein PEL8287_01537 [Roseovarius litorisediminis]
MAIFDFQGGDVTGTGGQYNVVNGTTHTSTVFTEQGISFSFTSDTIAEVPGNGGNAFTFLGSSATDLQGVVTVSVVDTDASQSFLKSVSISLASYGSGSGVIVLSNTVTGGKTTFTLPSTTFSSGIGPFVAADANAEYNKITFTANNGFMTVASVSGTPSCFMPGTMITTEHGETPVEDLQAGDLVRTADGRLTPVTWLGQQMIDTRLTHPAKVNPVCIRAGTLAENVPLRDLYLSGDHAIAINGTLYNAGALVNGTTIYRVRDMPRDGFSYYHVETEAHELLLAEGVAAETFIDYAGRDSFINAQDTRKNQIAEMSLPRVSAARLVPEGLRDTLLARADGLSRKAA